MLNKIKEIKKEMGDDLLILAHHYQNDQIVSVADYVGDSLKLAQMAEKNKTAKYIVFCGVHFMAETADILTEDWQKVLLPALTAGCPMANMADLDQAEKAWELLKAEFGDEETVPVTYINSKAEIKAFCGRHGGTTVTSGNAGKVLSWALSQKKRVLFLPDQNLGKNTAVDLGIPEEHMALYDQSTEKLTYACSKEDVKWYFGMAIAMFIMLLPFQKLKKPEKLIQMLRLLFIQNVLTKYVRLLTARVQLNS